MTGRLLALHSQSLLLTCSAEKAHCTIGSMPRVWPRTKDLHSRKDADEENVKFLLSLWM